MSIWDKNRALIFSAIIFASLLFIIFIHNDGFASDADPSVLKHIERLKSLKITEDQGVKYFDKARCWKKEGIHIAYLEGDPFEMGYQQGRLLKEFISINVKNSKSQVEKLGNSEALKRITKNIEKALPPEFIEEIKGIGVGSEVSYDDILGHNFWTVLAALKKQYLCSNFSIVNEATVDQKIIQFNTLDWTWGPTIGVLLIRRPSTGNGFVTFSEAGQIQATGSGLNEKGISVGHTGIHDTSKEYYSDEGVGKFLLLRKILQYASSIEDVQKILSADKVMEPCNYLVVDSKVKEARVFEVTAKGFKSRKQENNFLGSTNHFTLWREWKRRDESEDRLRFMEKFCKKNYGKIDLRKVVTLVREVCIAKIYPQGGIMTLVMMLFTPENLNFWVANAKEEGVPASWGPIVGFNLLKELGKGDKQLPDPITFPPGKE